MQIQEILNVLERLAPRSLQESYDNSGIQCGNARWDCTHALVCLDCTEAVIDEAIEAGCNLIISHHPLIFGNGLLSITGKGWEERVLIKAIKHDIVIYAIHTNLDNVLEGVNKKIAEKLGLVDTAVLLPKQTVLTKLTTYVPTNHAEAVFKALCDAGAGCIGEYSNCSFQTAGTGTFQASDKANPFVGEKGALHHESEVRIETVFLNHLEPQIVSALNASHPYEEVAFELVPIKNTIKSIGSGIIGSLEEPMDEDAFLNRVKDAMECKTIRHTHCTGAKISKIALCGGSGAFLLKTAIAQGAEAFVTADFKYHQFFDADNRILVADIGHYESEHFTIDLIIDILNNNFPTFAVRLSKINTNPINYF